MYKIKCRLSGEFYYGVHSTSDMNDGYMGSGPGIVEHLASCEAEHDKLVLYEAPTRERALIVEATIVDQEMVSNPFCLNRTIGGGGFDWASHNQNPKNRAHRVKGASVANKTLAKRKQSSERMTVLSKQLHEIGRIHPPDWTGRKHREETKKKIGLANALNQLGEGNSQFGTCWVVNERNEEKKIRREDLPAHIGAGWKQGRKLLNLGELISSLAKK